MGSYETEEDRDGRSVYCVRRRGVELARWLTKRTGRQWYTAAVDLQADPGFRAAQRGPDPDHYTLWGDKAKLARAARIVWPVG